MTAGPAGVVQASRRGVSVEPGPRTTPNALDGADLIAATGNTVLLIWTSPIRYRVRIGGSPFVGRPEVGTAGGDKGWSVTAVYLASGRQSAQEGGQCDRIVGREQAWCLLEAQDRKMAASSGHRGVNADPHLGPRQSFAVAPWMMHGRMPEWT
jgi:hypothetical protein